MRRLFIIGMVTVGVSCTSLFGCTKDDGPDDSAGSADETIDTEEVDPQPGHRESLYRTTYPTGRANLNGSRAVVDAGLPREATSDQIGVELFEMPFPNALITGDEDELFVMGGLSFIIENLFEGVDGQPSVINDVSPYFTKITISTGEQTVIPLDRGLGIIPYWGGMLMHANGFVYAVSQAHLYKIDPKSMEIEASVDLPMSNTTTIYNGVLTSSTGELILKSIGRDFVDLEFLLVDPDTMEIVLTQGCDCGSARLVVEKSDDGAEYLYHLNRQEIFRYLVEPGSLTLDNNWIAAWDQYGNGDENVEPTSPVIIQGKAHFTTNTNVGQVTDPMRVLWLDIEETHTREMPALSGPLHFEGELDFPGYSFSGLGGDDATGIMIGNDQGNGRINAFRTRDDGSIEILWQKELRVSANPSLVSDREMVYTTDYVDGSNHLVVLDLKTGEELIRVPTPATRVTFSTIVHSSNNETYIASPESGSPTGFVIRLYVREAE